MDKSEFLARIEEIDRQLERENVSLRARACEAFPRLVPGYNGPLFGYGVDSSAYPEYVGPNLFDKICQWYEQRYGDRVCLPSYIGRVPVIVRGQIYLIRIPIAYGRPHIKVLELVDGMTDGMIKSLDRRELTSIGEAFRDGFALIYEIDDLRHNLRPDAPSPFPVGASRILERAIQDRDAAVNCLDGRDDTNGVCFNAQQHAEKMMKAFLLVKQLKTEAELRNYPYGHDLKNIFKACLLGSASFADVTAEIGLLKGIPMDIRYSMPKVTLEIAVETVWASLRVGGLAACQIAGNKRRFQNPFWGRLV